MAGVFGSIGSRLAFKGRRLSSVVRKPTAKTDDQKSLCRSISDVSEEYDNSYGTIFFQIQEANCESSGTCDFMRRAIDVIWSTVLVTIILVLLFAMPIAMVAIGSSYREECPKEPKIPIYLIVGGAFGIMKLGIVVWRQRKNRDYEQLEGSGFDDDFEDVVMSRALKFSDYILTVFLLTWFILGNFWLYNIWEPKFKQPLHEPKNWCHEVVFKFTFYQFITCYGILGVVLIILFSILMYYMCSQKG